MRASPAAWFVLLLLVAVAGWAIGGNSSAQTALFLMGIAIGIIIGSPLNLLIAAVLGSIHSRQVVGSADHLPQGQRVSQQPLVVVFMKSCEQDPMPAEMVGGDLSVRELPPIRILGEE